MASRSWAVMLGSSDFHVATPGSSSPMADRSKPARKAAAGADRSLPSTDSRTRPAGMPAEASRGPGGRTPQPTDPAARTMASTSDHPKPTVSPATVRVEGSTSTKNG